MTPSPSPVPTDTGAPGFTIAVAPDKLNVPQGGSATIEVTVKPESGFADVVDVTVNGLPAGVTATALSLVSPETKGTITLTSLPTIAVPMPIEVSVRGHSSTGTKSVPVRLTVRGAPGDRDGSFGTDGEVTSRSLWETTDIARQPDAKLLITGWFLSDGPPEDLRLTICRFHPDGVPDVSFGAPDGCARLETGDGLAHGERLEIHGGKIYVVGFNDTASRGFIARLSLDGELDPTFGGTGLVALQDQFEPARLRFDDGGIVIAGGARDGSATLLRVRLDGTFDAGFAANHATFGVPGAEDLDLVRLGDGRLILGTRTTVYAFYADGRPDTSFAGDGSLEIPDADGGAATLSVDGSGGILATGSWMAVTRFSESGVVIATYPGLHPGKDVWGVEWTPNAEDLWVLDDGTMVLAGSCETDQPAICVGRRLPDGRPDPLFGTGGVVIVAIDPWGAHGVEVLPDGRYVLVANLHGYGAGLIYRIWD